LKYLFFFAWNPPALDVKIYYYYATSNTIQAGDILLSCYHLYVNGYFIPDNYSHATLYSDDEKLFMP